MLREVTLFKIMAPGVLRTLLIGDLHYHLRNLKDHELLATEIHNAIDAYAKLCPRSDEPPLDLIVCLGDEFDVHNPSADVRGAGIAFLRTLAAKTRHMIILVGNHTRKNNRVSTGPDHTLAEIHSDGGVTMVEDPQIMEINGVRFAALPYIHPDDFDAIIVDTCPELAAGGDRLSFVLGHQEINGAAVQPGRESTCHAHWPNNWPPLISGHIHERHHIRNVLYVGTPMQHSLNESTNKYIHFGELRARSGESSPWAYRNPEDGDILKQPCYVSSAGILHEFRMRGIPIRYSWDVDIRDTAALNGMLEYINENPINYYRIRVKYGDSQELLGNRAYSILLQHERVRVETCRVGPATENVRDDTHVPITSSYSDRLRIACKDKPELAAYLASIGGWMM